MVAILLALNLLAALPAKAELPTSVSVKIPSGEIVKFALPDEMCAYPGKVRKVLQRAFEAESPKLRLLGAAGDCYAIDRWRHGFQSAPISPTIQLAMLDSQVDPGSRMSASRYRAYCNDRFPARSKSLLSDRIRRSLQQIDNGLTLADERSLGILARTRHAIFGGELIWTKKGQHAMVLVNVVACFAPHDVPVLWTFSGAMDRSLPPGEIEKRLNAALILAEDRVTATLLLNGER